jgi:predicted dithiol-disulfide oxidoreductase (DUF899 family)
MSAFVLEEARVYSPILLMRADWTALGHVPMAGPRTKGSNETGVWWRRHDEYGRR